MPFHSHITTVSIFPHVLSRVDQSVRIIIEESIKKLKNMEYGSAAVLTGVGLTEGTQLAKDVISSKLKAYGYKSLFAVVSGPVIQFVSLPFYVFSYGSKFRRFALSATEIGAKITKGEMGIINWAWIGLEVVLFGEPVFITEDSDFLLVHNKTVGQLAATLEELSE